MKSQHKDVKGKDSFVGKQKTGWSRDKREKKQSDFGEENGRHQPGEEGSSSHPHKMIFHLHKHQQ